MTTHKKLNIEELGDYSYELLEDISRLMAHLQNSQFISSNKFIDINNKLKKAKELGLNVEKYETQIYDFRSALLKRRIGDRIEKIKNYSFESEDQSILDIHSIENIYLEYKEGYTERGEIDKMYQDLCRLIVYKKIEYMITDFIQGSTNSQYDVDKIMKELEEAEKKGIDVHDLKMQILGD